MLAPDQTFVGISCFIFPHPGRAPNLCCNPALFGSNKIESEHFRPCWLKKIIQHNQIIGKKQQQLWSDWNQTCCIVTTLFDCQQMFDPKRAPKTFWVKANWRPNFLVAF